MFLIVASASKDEKPIEQLLVVKAFAKVDGIERATGEIGIQFKREEAEEWINAYEASREVASNPPIFFSSAAKKGVGSASIFIWKRPPIGNWVFRAYLADSTFFNGEIGNVEIVLEAMTPDGIIKPERKDSFRFVDFGQKIVVPIRTKNRLK